MTIFRNPMEKMLEEQENLTVITNPKERFRTFFRKMAFRVAGWIDWLRRLFTRERNQRRR
jgi:hypothetical protein